MTFRERILAVINGERPDRIPWVPRLEIWYKAHATMGTLPAKYQGWTLPQIMKDLGVGHPARDGKLVEVVIDNTAIKETMEGNLLIRTHITPVGEATERIRINPAARSKGMPFEEGVVEHLIQGEEDYRVVEHLIANTVTSPPLPTTKHMKRPSRGRRPHDFHSLGPHVPHPTPLYRLQPRLL